MKAKALLVGLLLGGLDVLLLAIFSRRYGAPASAALFGALAGLVASVVTERALTRDGVRPSRLDWRMVCAYLLGFDVAYVTTALLAGQ